MKVIIPASGTGERFKAAGYKNTKPLINVSENKKIIDYVIDIFENTDEFFFIMSPETFNEMSSYISTLDINAKFILYEGDKLGPVGAIAGVYTELEKHINPSDEVIISYCDFGMEWDYSNFKDFLLNESPDAAIPCYTGFHPHLEPIENVYAACMVLDDGTIYEVKEKYRSQNKYEELWSPGVYYFKEFSLMRLAFDRMISNKDLLNGEYYVSNSYNHIPELKIKAYVGVNKFYQFGTPEDFELAKERLNMLDLKNEETDIKNTVILAAGKGERFLNLGYSQPKPFLPLKQTDLITNISDSFENNIEYIASLDHKLFWDNFNPSSDKNINFIKSNKIGAAYSYKEGASHIKGETLIVPCDLIAKHITKEFNKLKKTASVIVFTADATNYSLQNPNSFAWVSGSNNIISDISIKERMNVPNQMVLIGSFWVKENEFLLENVKEIFIKESKINGEYYLDSAFKNMLDKVEVNYIKLDKYFSLGTPTEYTNSKYWLD